MIHTILCISTGSSDVHVHLILRNVCSVSALIFDFENCCKNRVRWTHIISHHPLSCIDVIDMDWKKRKLKVQQGDNKLSKIKPYLGLSILLLGLICYRTISDFLENNFDPLANQLVSILLFLWQAPSAIFGWPAVFMQILGTCPYTIRPICPVHWSIFWNWICQIFITVIMDIWGLDIDDHINIEIYI